MVRLGGAASLAGNIKVGDYILSVSDVEVSQKPFQEVKDLLLGPAGSELTIKLARHGHDGKQEIVNATLKRASPLEREDEGEPV